MEKFYWFAAGFLAYFVVRLIIRSISHRWHKRHNGSINIGSINVHSKAWREQMVAQKREDGWKS